MFIEVVLREAMFLGASQDMILVPTVRPEAFVDGVVRGDICQNLPPAALVIDDRHYGGVITLTGTLGSVELSTF